MDIAQLPSRVSPPLTSKDLTLQLIPWDKNNLDALVDSLDETYSNPDLTWRLYGQSTARNLIEFITHLQNTSSGFFWVIYKDSNPVGFTGVRLYSEDRGILSTGTYLCGSARGGQVNTAVKDLLARASASITAPLISSVPVGNPRSEKAARKLLSLEETPASVWEEKAQRFAYIFPFPTSYTVPSEIWDDKVISECSGNLIILLRSDDSLAG